MDDYRLQTLLDERNKLIEEFKELRAALMRQVHQINVFNEYARKTLDESRKVLDTKVMMLP